MMQKKRVAAPGTVMKGIYSFVLIGCFVLLSLLIVLIGAKVYRHVDEASALNDQKRTALSYVLNKIRAGDRADCVSVETVDGRETLLIFADYQGTRYCTAIYYFEGYLSECFYRADRGLDPNLGDKLVPLQDFSVAMEEGLVSLSVTDQSGESAGVHAFVQTAGGDTA